MEQSCLTCNHLLSEKTKNGRTRCEAFPEGIPFEILFNGITHFKKRSDQKNNIVYKPKENKKNI